MRKWYFYKFLKTFYWKTKLNVWEQSLPKLRHLNGKGSLNFWVWLLKSKSFSYFRFIYILWGDFGFCRIFVEIFKYIGKWAYAVVIFCKFRSVPLKAFKRANDWFMQYLLTLVFVRQSLEMNNSARNSPEMHTFIILYT